MFSGKAFVDGRGEMLFQSSVANGAMLIESEFSLQLQGTRVKFRRVGICVSCCVRELLVVGSWEVGVGNACFDASVDRILLNGCQAAETTPFSGMIYLLVAFQRDSLREVPQRNSTVSV